MIQQQQAPQVDTGTIARSTNRQINPDNDPNRRRFGYAPGAWIMDIEPRLSGRQSQYIPQGILVRFETATLRVENFDIEKPHWTPQVERAFPAAEFIGHVKDRFQKPEADWGFRELAVLTPLDEAVYRDGVLVKADGGDAYFAAVHPSFEALKHECPTGLTVCPSCRIPFLYDEAGVTARATAAGLDPDIADALRLQLLEANEAFHAYATARWAEICGELDEVKNGGTQGIKALKRGEHHIRRVLHELAPEDRAADISAQYGAQQGDAILSGMERIAEKIGPAQADPTAGATQAAQLDVLKSIAEGQRAMFEMIQKQSEEIERLKNQPAEAALKGGNKTGSK